MKIRNEKKEYGGNKCKNFKCIETIETGETKTEIKERNGATYKERNGAT